MKVGIIGAGFGGISAAKILAAAPNTEVHLIDRRNYHLFQPLLYQVAMAGLNPSDIATPIRKLFSREKNITVTLAEVKDVDAKGCRVYFDDQWHAYDYLILACGAKHSYFGHETWEPFAPGLKTIEQATEIRRRVLTAFEMAEKEIDPNLQKSFLTFAVVGGGPTGVELAGAIAEMARVTLRRDYRRADLTQTKVYLIEAGPRILTAFPESLSQRAEKDLTEMGVEVVKNKPARLLNDQGLEVGETWIPCRTIIWAAGVKPSSLTQKIDTSKDPLGRLIVEKDLSLPGHPQVFALGDMTLFKNEAGRPLPGIAPVAIQQGAFVGKLILGELQQKPRDTFTYLDKGIMATIGKSRAVLSSGSFKLTGPLAWLAWVFVHIIYLMKFKNRVFVFFQWAWAYFRFGQSARLIIHKTWRFYE